MIFDDQSFTKHANDAIEKALREGQFDNLPGKGQPFQWDDWENPFVKEEDRVVNKILKEAGFTPGWITERKEIEEQAVGARKSLARSWQWVQSNGGLTDATAGRQWSLALAVFRQVVQELNQRIRDVNLIQPGQVPSLPLLDVEREIRQVSDGV
jgi:hypothetical protein